MENLSKTGKEYKLGIAELHVLAHVGSLEKRKQYINISTGQCTEDAQGNLISYINGFDRKRKAIMFMAHYDVVHEEYNNYLDNLASVQNLMQFARNNRKYKEKNIIIVFTNKEEQGQQGARYLAPLILKGKYGNVSLVVNLELTAIGKVLCINSFGKKRDYNFGYVDVVIPYSDAHALDELGVPAICIGTLDEENINMYRNNPSLKEWIKYGMALDRNGPALWNLCHQKEDNEYNKDDMEYFVKYTLPKFLKL